MRTKIYTELNGKLVKDWKNLWENSVNASFFNSYEWFLVCLKTYKITRYKIFLCYRGNTLVALFPGVIQKRFGVPVLTSFASGEHIPDSQLLIRSYENELIKYVVDTFNHKNNLFIPHVDARLAKEMKRSNKHILASTIARHPSIDLSKNPADFISRSGKRGIEKSIKRNLNALSYKLSEVGHYGYHHLETLIAIDQGSAKKLKGGDIFTKKVNRDLFQNILRYCPQFVRIAYLYYQSKPIAYMFNFIYNHTLVEFHTAYLQEHAKLSPGKILFYKMLHNLSQKSYKIFKFGLGFTGLNPTIEFQYDIYFTRNMVIRFWWKLINTVRRVKQVLFHRDLFKDYEFLFKALG